MKKLKAIFERIHRIELLVEEASKNTTNVFVIEDEEPMMIDTGPLSEANKKELERGVEKIGYRLEDIRRIVITHGHGDHYGLAQWVWSRGKPNIFIHLEDVNKVSKRHRKEIAEGSKEMFRTLFRFGVSLEESERIIKHLRDLRKYSEPIKTFHVIDESFSFQFRDFQLKVLHFPGHTSGSICLWDRSGLLFSGDSLLPGTAPVPVIETQHDLRGHNYRGLVRYLDTIKQIRELNLKRVYPGHGEIILNMTEMFDEISSYWEKRKKEILNLLDEGKVQPYQIVDWLLSKETAYMEFLPFIKLSEVVGVLEVLEEEGLVESFEEKDKLWYQKSKR